MLRTDSVRSGWQDRIPEGWGELSAELRWGAS
jgi:hypothetical protein